MKSQTHKRAEVLKQVNNLAGSTIFVAGELVTSALAQGFDLFLSLENQFHNAVFMTFFVEEIQPFADSKGRTTQVKMNAELVATGKERIVIPAVYRAYFFATINALFKTGRPKPKIQVLDYAKKWKPANNWSPEGNSAGTQCMRRFP